MPQDPRLSMLVAAFQSRLRSYAFGAELDLAAGELLVLLDSHRRRRADTADRIRLKALALAAEYLDAMGRAPEAAALLRLTAEELAGDAPAWPAELGGSADLDSTRRLMRQRVWCVMAYAQALLRAHRLEEAGRLIERMTAFVTGHLSAPGFPCHGTLALAHYYRGLWRRDLGQLNEAAWDFDMALEQTQRRYADKQAKYGGADAERLRRELIYCRVNTARILGFGHGGIALSRGRYREARGWLLGAQQILAQMGQEMWRLGLEVYGRSAAVLVQERNEAGATRLEEDAARLNELAKWFQERNPRQAYLAEVFSLVATVRAQMVRVPAERLDLGPVRKRLERCLQVNQGGAGPLAATAALQLADCLLRAGEWKRGEAELERCQRVFGNREEAGLDFSILRAELSMETGRTGEARALLAALVEQRPANRAYRARAWALLAVCEEKAGQRQWAERAAEAARDSLAQVQDGFAKSWVEEILARIGQAEMPPAPMPYQQPGDDGRWCDLDHNLEMARLHVIESVYRRFPGHSVEKLAVVMGRGPSWLYAFLAKHREVEWVKELLGR